MIFFFHHENPILTFLHLRLTPDNRTLPSRSVSQLSYSSVGSGSVWAPQYSSGSYLPGPDDSSGEDEQIQAFPFYQSHQGSLSHASQESLNSSNPPPQVLSFVISPVSFWFEVSSCVKIENRTIDIEPYNPENTVTPQVTVYHAGGSLTCLLIHGLRPHAAAIWF